jgi:phage shock protein PspC (stress-responsive transcriptional regulator)
MAKRLYRSRTDRKLWGVCGGLGEYFNVDPVIFRIVFVVSIFFASAGIIAYIIMAIIVPEAPAGS